MRYDTPRVVSIFMSLVSVDVINKQLHILTKKLPNSHHPVIINTFIFNHFRIIYVRD